jgi:hypothetical protein
MAANDDTPEVRSIWPIPTEQGPAIRAIFSDKHDPVVWQLTPDEAVSFCMELLKASRFPKVS